MSFDNWEKVGGPGEHFHALGDHELVGISPGNTAVYHRNHHGHWTKIGGPIRHEQLAVAGGRVYGVSPNADHIYRWTGYGESWEKVGENFKHVIGGGNHLFAVHSHT